MVYDKPQNNISIVRQDKMSVHFLTAIKAKTKP